MQTAAAVSPFRESVSSAARARVSTIVTRAPARLDLAGGWTDVPPYCDEQGGCVCNIAITRRATVRLALDDHASPGVPGRVEHSPRLATAALARAQLAPERGGPAIVATVWSDFPMSAGLGGSSAAGVALAAATRAWDGTLPDEPLDDACRAALAEWSRAVEVEDAGIAGGRQDHYAAAFGGALRLDFGADAGGAPTRVTRLAVDAATRAAFVRRAVVVYTGESRISGDTITAVTNAYAAREPRVVHALARMKAIAHEMAEALERGRLDDVGALLDEHWTHQRALHPKITTARIDALVDAGRAAGAIGAKALGASGGGCVLLLAADGREDALRAAATPLGDVVTFDIDDAGVRVLPS
jgi:D-glycero-alpha-D-manno-heptose-7-phosphate kinase